MRGTRSAPNRCSICGALNTNARSHDRGHAKTRRNLSPTRSIQKTRPLHYDSNARLRRESPLVSRRVRPIPLALLPGSLTHYAVASYELPAPGSR